MIAEGFFSNPNSDPNSGAAATIADVSGIMAQDFLPAQARRAVRFPFVGSGSSGEAVPPGPLTSRTLSRDVEAYPSPRRRADSPRPT